MSIEDTQKEIAINLPFTLGVVKLVWEVFPTEADCRAFFEIARRLKIEPLSLIAYLPSSGEGCVFSDMLRELIGQIIARNVAEERVAELEFQIKQESPN